MSKILLVDDMAICREPVAEALRDRGFHVTCASDGREALSHMGSDLPDLLILDVLMPEMDGLEVLRRMRKDARFEKVPVILLTDVGDRDHVLGAQKLGIQDYFLKADFSMEKMVSRIRKHLPSPDSESSCSGASPAPRRRGRGEASVRETRAADGTPTRAPGTEPPSGGQDDAAPPGKVLTRAQVLQGIGEDAEAKTLAGTVAEVIQIASSREASPTDLSSVLNRDPVLASRVIKIASSAAFSPARSRVRSLDDAVRGLGFARIRDLTASIGLIVSLPSDGPDGFNIGRCWQHCLAAASILDKLFPVSDRYAPGLPHLVGLCHQIGEIVLRQSFPDEFSRAVERSVSSGKTLQEVLGRVFGIPYRELISLVLTRQGLPAAVSKPIQEFIALELGQSGSDCGPLAGALRLAKLGAHGMLLTSSNEAAVGPVLKGEYRKAFGSKSLPGVDWVGLRTEVLTTVSLLGRLSSKDTARLSEPPIRPVESRLWYARHHAFSNYDPLGMALQHLTQTEIHDRLPESGDESSQHDGLVVAAPKADSGSFSLPEIMQAASSGERPVPVLWVVGKAFTKPADTPENVTLARSPVRLEELGEFLSSVEPRLDTDETFLSG